MEKQNQKRKLKEQKTLQKKINKWNHEYYVLSKPSVDDYTYDQEIKRLERIEKELHLESQDSPTKEVGSSISNLFKKREHLVRSMLSLDNTFSFDELLDFQKRIRKLIGNDLKLKYSVELKIDGLSVSLYYKDGKLIYGLTRGDGKVGEDVTKNILQIEDIPKTISIKKEIVVRGEVYLPITSFLKINKEREEASLDLFANPRNAASGTLRQLDEKVVKKRNLKSFFYMLLDVEKNDDYCQTQEQTLKTLSKNGFQTEPSTKYIDDIKDSKDFIDFIVKERNNFPFEIDGIVFKVDDYSLHSQLGETSKFPRWGIAFKLPTEIKETRLLKIFPTVGRTGLITYNAELEPVNILKTKVSFATLHNADYIQELDLRENDLVMVKIAGDIIPKVVGLSSTNVRGKSSKKWTPVVKCPSCNSILVKPVGEVDQYCLNEECPERRIQAILHFVSRKAMNIEFLAEQQIRKFYKLGMVKNIFDIFLLKEHKEEILKIQGYKEKSVNRILDSIEKSKNNSLERLLFALGIKNIGQQTASYLARTYSSIRNISKLGVDNLMENEDFAEAKSTSVVEWFKNRANIELLEKFEKIGVNFNYLGKKVSKSSKYFGKKVLVTGVLKNATREQIKEHLLSIGAIVMTTVSNKLDYLFVGEKPSEDKIKKVNRSKIIKISRIEEII